MANVRFLDLVKPIMFLIPEISSPTKQVIIIVKINLGIKKR